MKRFNGIRTPQRPNLNADTARGSTFGEAWPVVRADLVPTSAAPCQRIWERPGAPLLQKLVGGGGWARLQEMSQEPSLPNGQMAGPLLPSPRLHGCVLMCDVLPEGRGWPWVQPCDFSHHWAGREQGGSPPVGLSQGNPSSFRETAGTRDRAGRRHHILWVVLTNI